MNLKTIFLSLLTFIILAFAFMWFGMFNISAQDKHWAVTTEMMEFVRDRSVETRADDIEVPALDSPEMIANGAKNYDAMCSQCHLAPEMAPTELNLGLYPQPPVFYKQEHESDEAANTFWTIKNGLKLTGMPAWGDFHTDEQMWEMVAFLNKLNGMDKATYKELVGEGGHTHKGGGHGDSGHGEQAHDNSDNHHGAAQESTHDNSDGHHDIQQEPAMHDHSEHNHVH